MRRLDPTRSTSHKFLAAFALALLTMLVSTSAFAEHPVRAIDAKFQKLTVFEGTSNVSVRYRFEKRNWRALRRRRLRPTLEIKVARTWKSGAQVVSIFAAPLGERAGTFTFPRAVSLHGASHVEVSVTGRHGRWRMGNVSLGRRCAAELRRPVVRSRGGGTRCGSRDADRCDRGTTCGGRDRARCGRGGAHRDDRDRADRGRRGPRGNRGRGRGRGRARSDWRAEVIAACKKHTSYASQFDSCLERGLELDRRHAASTVATCGEHTSYPSRFKKCLDQAATFGRRDPAPSIEACAEATSYPSRFSKCVETAAKYETDASAMIAACDAATEYPSRFTKCLEEARSLGRGGERIVRACGEGASNSSGIGKCIRRSVRASQRDSRRRGRHARDSS
jgi:hypothetical protein